MWHFMRVEDRPISQFGLAEKISNVSDLRDKVIVCADINSIAVEGSPESTGVATLISEACHSVDILGVNTSTIMKTEGTIQDLTHYFSRPVSISRGTLPATLSRIFSHNIGANLGIESFPNGVNRMTGVYGFRATMVFTLQVATTPFHQGVLGLGFQYGSYQGDSDGAFDRGAFPEMITNLPHVRLDLAETTMVQLRVPYLNETEYTVFSSVSSSPRYGVLSLTPVLPVSAVPSSAAPTYQIFMHWEDIEIFGARPANTTVLTFQSGKKLSKVAEEFEDEAYPFSSATHALSRSVKWLSKGVPLIESVAGPTVWFLEKASGAIRSFGYSRPQNADPIPKMCVVDNAGEFNVDKALPLSVVGAYSTNSLRHGSEFSGTNVDEMSMTYILSKPTQICRFTLPTTAASGTLLYATEISPSFMWFRTTGTLPVVNRPPRIIAPTDTNGFLPSSLFYFGQMFKFWKGSVKFRFTFSKTKMHGGRVMVSYAPYTRNESESLLGSNPTGFVASFGSGIGADPFGISTVFNLRDGNVFEFEVPYMSDRPFTNFTGSTGSIAMYVVDALQAPNMVASSIDVLVEVMAMDDFEFANPRTPLYASNSMAVNSTITFQSGKVLSQSKDNHVEFTMGESISSVKQLIGIPKFSKLTFTQNQASNYLIPPWYYSPRPSLLLPSPSTNLPEALSIPGMVSQAFVFCKGSTDLHVYSDRRDGFIASLRQVSNTGTGTSANPVSAVTGPNSSNIRVITGSNGALHARLPAYQQLIRFLTHSLDAATSPGTSWGLRGTQYPAIVHDDTENQSFYKLRVKTSNVASTVYVSRCAGDDAALCQYIGPVPLLLLSAATSLAYDNDMIDE